MTGHCYLIVRKQSSSTLDSQPHANIQFLLVYQLKLKSVSLGPRDPHYITPLIASLLRKRYKLRRKGRISEADDLALKINEIIANVRSKRFSKLSDVSTKVLRKAVQEDRVIIQRLVILMIKSYQPMLVMPVIILQVLVLTQTMILTILLSFQSGYSMIMVIVIVIFILLMLNGYSGISNQPHQVLMVFHAGCFSSVIQSWLAVFYTNF